MNQQNVYTIVGDPLIKDSDPFLNTVYRRIKENSSKIFARDTNDGKSYTFGDLLEKSQCWAQWLMDQGLGRGNVVSIGSENNFEGLSVILGTWLSGAAANPINTTFTSNDLKVMLEVTEPEVVYCNSNIDCIKNAVKDTGKSIILVTPGGKYPYVNSQTIFENKVNNFQPYAVTNQKEHVLNILFTSGTTGIPKGVQVTDFSGQVFTKSIFSFPPPILLTSPVFWLTNLGMYSSSLFYGNELILPKSGWTSRDILELITKYKPHSWFTGHSLLLELSQSPKIEDYDLSSLKLVATGGSILMANQRRLINENIFKNKLVIHHLYGSTELGVATKWSDNIDVDSEEYNTVGVVENGISLKIMSSDGEQLGPRQNGEIVMKSEFLSPAYLTLHREIKILKDEDGWFHTGDIGYYDEKKLLYIVGRLKEIMKYRGIQIAPAEIENVLNEHPDVYECCVIGKPDVVNGDIPVAFVVLRESAKTSVNDLHEYSKRNIAQMKRPHEIIILNAIPKSSIGKFKKRELEEMLE